MVIECPHCHQEIEVNVELALGQHVRCPYCCEKFSYGFSCDQLAQPEPADTGRRANIWHGLQQNISRRMTMIVGVIGVIGLVILGCFLFAPNGHKRSYNLEFREKSYSPSECPVADTTLSANMNSPTVGTGYFHLPDTVNLAVEQVLDGDGVLVAIGQSRIFIRTDREYVDGSMLSFGLYVSIGTVKYTSVNGTPRTIWAFEEVDRDLAKTRYENAVRAKIEEELKRKKIAAQQEFERKQAQMKADEMAESARMELERQAVQHKLELEKLKQQQAQKEEEERIKRKPKEQEMWAEYASNKLSAVSLKLGNYIGLQKDLNRYVFSVSVTEKSWAALVETQAKKDWLGFLSVVANEKLKEYPEPKTVDMYVERLLEMPFHAECLFTHDLYIRSCVVGRDEGSACNASDTNLDQELVGLGGRRGRRARLNHGFGNGSDSPTFEKKGNGKVIVVFSLASVGKLYLYSTNGRELYDLDEKVDKNKKRIEEDRRLGRINDDQAEAQEIELEKRYWEKVKGFLSTSRVDASHAERIRGQMKTDEKSTRRFNLDLDISASESDEFSNDGASYSDGGVKENVGNVCQSCKGRRYVVKKIECNKCGGTGKIITPAKKLIVGYSKERSSTCKDCYGTGFKKQRVKCADCNNGMD